MGVRDTRAALAILLALAMAGAAAAQTSPGEDPENGTIAAGRYDNPYFGLTYPLPAGYGEGLAPAPASSNGYYVLNTPAHLGGPGPSILIAAQDMFFAFRPESSALQMLTDLRDATARGGAGEAGAPAAEATIAGHNVARVEVGDKFLQRLVVATAIRCHIVSITLAATDRATLDQLAASFESLSLPAAASATGDGSGDGTGTVPACIKDYARPDTILHQVQPALGGPKFLKIPVRIIIGKDGKVRHVHVIRASDADKNSIEKALMQWQFKPREVKGQPVEVETGLVFEKN